MRYTLPINHHHYNSLVQHLFSDHKIERAAYLLCALSDSDGEKRLLVREMIPVPQEEVDEASDRHMVIKQLSYLRAIKRAHVTSMCFIFVHSHPEEYRVHSPQDDIEEADLFRSVYARIHNDVARHGSIVFSKPSLPIGRIWLPNGDVSPIERVRVIGDRFAFYDPNDGALLDISQFNRQILAFGEHTQRLLSRLHIGVVGLGGTGSAL